jgi:hypothetical protein
VLGPAIIAPLLLRDLPQALQAKIEARKQQLSDHATELANIVCFLPFRLSVFSTALSLFTFGSLSLSAHFFTSSSHYRLLSLLPLQTGKSAEAKVIHEKAESQFSSLQQQVSDARLSKSLLESTLTDRIQELTEQVVGDRKAREAVQAAQEEMQEDLVQMRVELSTRQEALYHLTHEKGKK